MARAILFLGLMLGLLLGAHLLLFHYLVRFLAVSHPAARAALIGLCTFFALSVPGSVILVRLWESAPTRGFYVLAAVWLGLLINLLVAIGLSWLVLGVSRLAGRAPPLPWIGVGALVLAALFTCYGIWRAFHPQLTRVEVSLEGLPESWRNKTLVQLSDLHLGHINGAGFLRRVVEQVNALEPEAVVITGDLFDGMGGDFASFVGELDRLRARRGVFFVTGNHEIYARDRGVRRVLAQTKLRVLDNTVVQLDGLQLVGVAFPGLSGEEGRKTLERIRADLAQDRPSILLFHTPSNIAATATGKAVPHYSTYWRPDTSCAVNRELGIDLQLSGHTHAGQLFPFGLLTRLIYGGRDRGLHRDGAFALFVSSGTGTWGPPVRTAGRSEIVVIRLLGTSAAP
jgi:predicted MPP superfamily phosphohydrolase